MFPVRKQNRKDTNSRAVFYFVDNNEQRYVRDIQYQLKPFLSTEQFEKEWIRRNLSNKKILLMESEKMNEGIKEDGIAVLQQLTFNDDFVRWIQTEAVEKLLTYYENHQEKRSLARWLGKIDYSNISVEFRKTLMDYYMEVGMMAFFGIELYGCDIMGSAKILRLASFGAQYYQGKKDEETLSLAYAAFIRKKCNKDTLTYLMKHFQGETAVLLDIWERGRRFGLETADFERKILEQVMFTGNDTEGVFPVFESFYQTNEGDDLIDRYLEYASMKELESSMELNDFMHMAIGQEIVNGRMENRHSRIHFLYYFAGREEWYDTIKDTAVYIIEGFLQEKFYLPIYHAYAQWVHFPIYYRELTFLTYRGRAGQHVILNYQIDGEQYSFRNLNLEEVLPGMYVCHMNFFQRDHVKYRLEADGKLVADENALEFETFEYEDGEESRFFTLNYLDTEEASLPELKEYLLKTFFADQCMKLL